MPPPCSATPTRRSGTITSWSQAEPAPDLAAFRDARRARFEPDDPAFIVYTSGTTGHPKGALVAHGKHLAATANIVAHYPTLAEKEHRTVVYLPLCHVLGRDVAVTLPLISRLVPHFGEDTEDLPTTLFEVAPTVLFTVPRYLQKFASQVLIGILNSTGVKRATANLALRFARGYARRRWDGAAGVAQELPYAAARTAVFRPVLNKLGLDQVELLICAGAPLPHETMALWQMLGVNVVEMYGQTETAGGIISGQRGPFPRPGDVGTVPDGWEVRLAADGEVLVRSPDLFDGYWNNAEATRATKSDDGWLRTGDIGEWRDGALRLIDRARDFIVTSGGKTISPSFIENIVRTSPYVAEAVVFGHGRKYLTALIEIDSDTVSDWARSHDVPYTGFTSLASSAQVVEADQDGDRPDERRAVARRADQGFPHPAEGARSGGGRRADHADAQGEAASDVRALQGAGRGDVRRPRGAPDRQPRNDSLNCGPSAREGAKCLPNTKREKQGRTTMLKQILIGALAGLAIAIPAHAQDAYVIGVTGALTGPSAGTNAPPIEGLRLYVDRLNAAGGVNGKKIQLTILDDSASPRRPPPTPSGC